MYFGAFEQVDESNDEENTLVHKKSTLLLNFVFPNGEVSCQPDLTGEKIFTGLASHQQVHTNPSGTIRPQLQ